MGVIARHRASANLFPAVRRAGQWEVGMVGATKLARAAAIFLTGLGAAVTSVQAQPAPFYLGQVIFMAAN
jgi:hypothetical protein